ncbi:MAG: hypothetical protein M3P04_08370, partial [Actinomycetota bacterium]|nr:hypothetical protein [Actinomycetota bacterium]
MRASLKMLAASMGSLALVLSSVAMAAAEPAGPSITSDQADYAPGEVVTIAGAGWAASEAVHLTVDDSDGQTWRYQADPVTDAAGAFRVQFTLPDWFVANYTAVATDASGATATTRFTDSNIQVAAVNPDGGIVVNVLWTTYR